MHFKSSINWAAIDAPASLLHLASFNSPKILHLWVKPKIQIRKRNNMDIIFFHGINYFHPGIKLIDDECLYREIQIH
jgi:hypothetical protein